MIQLDKNNQISKLLRCVILCLILFSAFTVYIAIPQEHMFARGADEGYYFMYAKIVKEKGISQFPLLLQHYLSDKADQLYPPPGRIGHILITALWFKLFPNTFVSLAHLSFLCFVLFLMVSFYFSGRFFGQDLAYLYTLLLSSSPLIMTSGRRVLPDGILNLFWALSIWLFLDFLTNKKRAKFIIFLLVYSVSITIKESSIALFMFFVLFYFLYKYKYKQDISGFYFLGLFLFPLFFVGSSYLFLLNGLNNFITLIKFILDAHFPPFVTNMYSLFGMGPWYKYIIDYLMLTPITTLLSIGYLFYILVSRRFEWKMTYFMAYLLIIYAVFSSTRYTRIVRYVMSLDVAICLFAVLALYELFRQKNKDYQIYSVIMAAIIIFFVNYCNFIYLFYNINIYDPISCLLLIAKRIIPLL